MCYMFLPVYLDCLCVAGKTDSGGVRIVWSHHVHSACHEGDTPPGVPCLLLHSGRVLGRECGLFFLSPH